MFQALDKPYFYKWNSYSKLHIYLRYLQVTQPIPVAMLSKSHTVLDRSITVIVGFSPGRGIVSCPRFSVLCSPV